jgi:hypothetical protein
MWPASLPFCLVTTGCPAYITLNTLATILDAPL